MSLDDLNREQKRLLRRQGALDESGAPTRAPRQQAVRQRVGPAQYLREVRDEMRKVAWPSRPEVVRYSIIVTSTVAESSTGGAFSFTDRGVRPLKGLEQSRHLLAVELDDH